MIVTHFSLGSFLSSHGRSISPFLIRREWKYLGGWCWKPVVEAARDVGADWFGEEKGFGFGTGRVGLLPVVPGLIDVTVMLGCTESMFVRSYNAHGMRLFNLFDCRECRDDENQRGQNAGPRIPGAVNINCRPWNLLS